MKNLKTFPHTEKLSNFFTSRITMLHDSGLGNALACSALVLSFVKRNNNEVA
jgi:hypothetical protein